MASKKELQRKHEAARLDVERARRNKNYLDFLDAAAKGEERSYEQSENNPRNCCIIGIKGGSLSCKDKEINK